MRRWVLCCLLFALPLYGLSGAVAGLLGSSHSHEPAALPIAAATPADPMAGWYDFRRVVAQTDGGHASHDHGRGRHTHAETGEPPSVPVALHDHGAWERHHHAPQDISVVALDGGSHDDVGGAAAPVVLALIGSADWRLPERARAPWPATAEPPIASRGPLPLEHPPKA